MWFCGFIHRFGIASSVNAESWAAKLGLELVWDLSHRRLILEVESEVVPQPLEGDWDATSSSAIILHDIGYLLQTDWMV